MTRHQLYTIVAYIYVVSYYTMPMIAACVVFNLLPAIYLVIAVDTHVLADFVSRRMKAQS